MEGLSFLVRVHNEETTIEASLRSLFNLAVVYEILVFLNSCTDRSGWIASRLADENPRSAFSSTMRASAALALRPLRPMPSPFTASSASPTGDSIRRSIYGKFDGMPTSF